MKKNKYILDLFFCLILIQLAVPVSMIVRREMTLRNGSLFRFRTAPVDPYDAFRGRYVALRMEQNSAPLNEGPKLLRNQKVYALIEKDDHDFAKIVGVTLHRPKKDSYILSKVQYVSNNNVILKLPFNRYYMDEKLAPVAEDLYRKHNRRDAQDAYVTIRIKSGFAVLEELYVGGKPILEFIQEQQQQQQQQ